MGEQIVGASKSKRSKDYFMLVGPSVSPSYVTWAVGRIRLHAPGPSSVFSNQIE